MCSSQTLHRLSKQEEKISPNMQIPGKYYEQNDATHTHSTL